MDPVYRLYAPVTPGGTVLFWRTHSMRCYALQNVEHTMDQPWKKLYRKGWRIKRARLVVDE